MIKVSVMYPNREDAHFDHDYYRESHMPLVARRLGAACLYYTVDRGIAGMPNGTSPPFAAMCHLFFDSFETFVEAITPVATELEADVSKFTNIKSVMQVSAEVANTAA